MVMIGLTFTMRIEESFLVLHDNRLIGCYAIFDLLIN